ncbi:MAG: PTS transporter subunit EIIC [Spirochaetaceae bacterium]|jgi:PTS system cellobiose-specific IIC component|nr:PTS transporter subunit EIIC [Spirochaetaceae bacterium]
MNDFLNQKVLPALIKIINTKTVQSFKNGMLYIMPLTIVGSIFLLLANFPWSPVVSLLNAVGLTGPFNQIVGATFGIMALVAVVAIPFEYCKAENIPGGLNAGIISLSSFLIVQESFIITDAGLQISDVLDKGWLGGRGIIAAILIGLLSGKVYAFFIKKDIRIKLPAGVPEGIANSFNGLIPACAMFLISALIYMIFKGFWGVTAIEAIYKVIQLPLQGMTDSLPGAIMLALIVPFLWFFGIHGASLVGAVMGPILQANMLENQALLDAGVALTVANGGHIVTQQFMDQFQTVTGSGMTIGLVLYISFLAKSVQNKQLGKLTLIPGFFNINEPILFGVPVVLNPLMAVPFIMMPVISSILLYFCQYTGIVPLFGAVMVPWTTPPVISGFIVGGWKIALLQAIILASSFFVYLPFIKKVDQMNLEQEKAGSA